MALLEIDLVPGENMRIVGMKKCGDKTYSSSITSRAGKGSSRPKLIISHPKLLVASTPSGVNDVGSSVTCWPSTGDIELIELWRLLPITCRPAPEGSFGILMEKVCS